MGALTKEILEGRRGVNLGYFYLLRKGEKGALGQGTKCLVCKKGDEINVWDGAAWHPYSDFEPHPNVESTIEACERFNGKIP